MGAPDGVAASAAHEGGQVQVIAVDGDLDRGAIEQIEQLATQAVQRRPSAQIIIDLTAVAFIANRELVAVVGLLRRLTRKGASIAIASRDARARGVLATIGMGDVVLAAVAQAASRSPLPEQKVSSESRARASLHERTDAGTRRMAT